MTGSIRKVAAVANLLMFLACAAYMICAAIIGLDESPRIEKISTSAAPQSLRLLFVGNSYVFRNQMPKTFSLMESGSQKIWEVVASNCSLEKHWNQGLAQKVISNDGPWDYVVLQESDARALDDPDSGKKYLAMFSELVRKQGGKPLLYVTWARKNKPGTINAMMNQQKYIAEASQVELLPAGQVFHQALKEKEIAELYDPDGYHPSKTGSYLVAAVLYFYLHKKGPAPIEALSLSTKAQVDITNCVKSMMPISSAVDSSAKSADMAAPDAKQESADTSASAPTPAKTK